MRLCPLPSQTWCWVNYPIAIAGLVGLGTFQFKAFYSRCYWNTALTMTCKLTAGEHEQHLTEERCKKGNDCQRQGCRKVLRLFIWRVSSSEFTLPRQHDERKRRDWGYKKRDERGLQSEGSMIVSPPKRSNDTSQAIDSVLREETDRLPQGRSESLLSHQTSHHPLPSPLPLQTMSLLSLSQITWKPLTRS